MLYHLRKLEYEQYSKLEHILGTKWSVEEANRLLDNKNDEGNRAENVSIPLTQILAPEQVRGYLKMIRSESDTGSDTKTKSVADLSKEEFLKMFRGGGGLKPVTDAVKRSRG